MPGSATPIGRASPMAAPLPAIAVYALTRKGAALARSLAKRLAAAGYDPALVLPRRLADEFGPAQYFETLGQALASRFHSLSGHVVVAATGLTVRIIAPLLKSKTSDPAVVVLPQDGRFAISLLSGHLGGGNRLAEMAARAVGGQAVISTATDIEDRPALEVLARDHGLAFEDLSNLAYFSRCLVEGDRVRISDPGGFLAPHLSPWPDSFDFDNPASPRVLVDYRLGGDGPLDLVLRPRALFLGLGCHRGVDQAELEEFIGRELAGHGLAKAAIAALATVETRIREPALLSLCRENDWPLLAFDKAELGRIKTPNPSETVNKNIGVASVCEAAALLAARTDRLVMTKTKSRRATLAAALRPAARPLS
ncbi:MAG: cobalamin biosynthesis protein [Deltaproteobacteria bacterium]|nr:cobalamin biosynthesis protein [Deltaproteobacteria bacterium]